MGMVKAKSGPRRWALGLGAAAMTATVLSGGVATVACAAPAKVSSAAYTPATRTLRPDMRGNDVKRLQRRLAQLAYYPGTIDGHYGSDTEEAVWAFEEVQNMPASGTVTVKVERVLVNPRYPTPLVAHGAALRVEVSLGRHVLYVYHSHRIELISHISSSGGYYYCDSDCSYAITPTGNFRTTWRVKGWHTSPLGELYNPVFFYSGFAIHGDTYVPIQPVSHGCIRIPTDVANIFPGLVPGNGIPVYVRARG